LGPDYTEAEIRAFLDTYGYPYRRLATADRSDTIASLLEEGKVVGYFSGRMEFGPRALGSRSIIGDARNEEMQVTLNLKTKFRESFRPFAPAVLWERVHHYFEHDRESPYMLMVAPVKRQRCKPFDAVAGDDLLARVRQPRSDIPAVTHVDYSARIQTVAYKDHASFYELMRAFEKKTGCAVIVNTSFNVRGEPIVCTPAEAYRCLMRTGMDALILEDFLVLKTEQPPWFEKTNAVRQESRNGKFSPEATLIAELTQIFRDEFMQIAADLRQRTLLRVQTEFRHVASTWKELATPEIPEEIFSVPPELDQLSADAEAMVGAMIKFWDQNVTCEMLRPVLVKLLRLGLQYQPGETPEEEVPQAVYVMF
jgi:carbamoyltransferase